MKKWLDSNKVAMLTGAAIQDDETFKSEGGFIPERDQYYFQMQQGGNVFLVGFKDLLTCLRLLEKLGEIPEIGDKWWLRIRDFALKNKSPCSACEFQAKQGISILGIKLLFFSV